MENAELAGAIAETRAGDFSDSARFAFVTDSKAPTLAVVDMLAQQASTNIPLDTTADLAGISKAGHFIAYAEKGGKTLHFLDLASLEHSQHSDGRWITYANDQLTTLLDRKTGKETTFATDGGVSLLYHPTGDYLFIAETKAGRLRRVDLASVTEQQLFDLAMPMSPISIMPNGIALFFAADGIVQRYSLLDEKVIPLAVKAARYRPYMTSDSRVIFALSAAQPQQLLAINAYTYEAMNSYPLPDWQMPVQKDSNFVITGWLEQVAVLADDTAMYSLQIDNPDSLQVQKKSAKVRDMLVQADSKTLLITETGSDKLALFDMKSQQFVKHIDLGLANPDQLLMGETNTLCH